MWGCGMAVAESGIGVGVQRREDRRLLTGGGRYVSDLTRPGMLHLAATRSPHAHAGIAALDVTAAERLWRVVWAAHGAAGA